MTPKRRPRKEILPNRRPLKKKRPQRKKLVENPWKPNKRKPKQRQKPKPKILPNKKPKKKNKERYYNPNKWITITFLRKPNHTFFPSNIFPETINSVRMNYFEAKRKPNEFWRDKKIIFHMADRTREEWLPYYKKVINNAKIAWIKFAAKSFMTDMTHLDRKRYKPPLSFYRIIDDACDNILWELPPNYEGFWKNKNKVPLTLYDKSYEVPIKNKDIDFLGVIDNCLFYNYTKTLELLRMLSQAGYKVKCILIKDAHGLFRKYNKKTIGIETIPNRKNTEGQKIYYNLCQKSKIVVDFSFRWTYGRVIYEALFNGAISICTHTYGASHHLFPDLIVDTSNFNMQKTYKKCIDVVEKWSPNLVRKYRQQAQSCASPQIFANKLNNESNRILGK